MRTGLRNALGGIVFALSGAVATGGAAQAGPVVVELFTSQGCSSCPPADAMMIELAARDDVVALAFHVDYWDYIGWNDSFGSPQNTARQSAYAHAANTTTVYTPQFIVGGVDHVIGARGMELVNRIDEHKGQDSGVGIEATRDGEQIIIQAEATTVVPMTVQVIRYSPLETVDIERGENAGLLMDYANTVMEWSVVAEWDGSEPLALSVPVTGDLPSVILVQTLGAGPILAAIDLR